MDITVLKQELLDGKIRPTYIFTGDELALQDIYIDKIMQLSGLDKVVVDNLKSVYSKLSARTLVKVAPKIYCIRNDEHYVKDDKVWDKVIQGKNQGKNIIIFRYTGLDKRGKFCKAHEEILTEFSFIGESLLKNRVQALTKWPIQYCEDLVKICGCNYGRIKNELYKLETLAKVNNYSLSTAYLEAKKNNLIHKEIGDIIFDFTNAVIERNIVKSYELYEQIKKTDEGPVKLISVLYNSFRNIMLVQSTPLSERTEEVLGLTKGQIFVTSQKCDRYSIYEIVDIVKLLQKAEKGIKTGELDVNYIMEYLLGVIF